MSIYEAKHSTTNFKIDCIDGWLPHGHVMFSFPDHEFIILQAEEAELHKSLQSCSTWQNTMDHHLLNIPAMLTRFRGIMELKKN